MADGMLAGLYLAFCVADGPISAAPARPPMAVLDDAGLDETGLDESGQDDADIIVVTGERVPRTLLETSSSVVVMTAETIGTQAGADRIEQLLILVPNVQLGSGGEGPAIRGQDWTGVLRDLFAFVGGARPRVALQVDGRAVSYYEFVYGAASAWDVERLEVFRSPQTTTQGRNSIAGAIFVNSKAPTFAWKGAARILAGDYRTRQASAVVSGPLIEDQLAIRLDYDESFDAWLPKLSIAYDLAKKINAGLLVQRV